MKLKKRFIAGAVCPECKAQDTLMLYLENSVEKVECVDCGHKQSKTTQEVEKVTKTTNQVIGLFKPE
ncbi:YheV family putative zinc ribbon protein [Catenovulum maritimum]|uniref:DNA-binding protein n=1 Tax=Catenovulum maritimum TaxID=1513271 RepID=A0A0J8GQL4_9ALTE|nr:YheV family putative zinc ribbon protein [Catenovulum maritimum]KMT65075.1 DNA-binding protein [Catenovulum maritimum]